MIHSGNREPETAEPETAEPETAEPETARAGTQAGAESAGAGQPGVAGWLRRAWQRNWVRHLALLLAFELAGIAVTWPLLSFAFTGKLVASQDIGSFTWDLWWVAHHLFSPQQIFHTTYMAAPVGADLAYSTTMPLAGAVMAPITLLAGPGVSLVLLGALAPGLQCYAMYRAARLWLNQAGAITAGAFFGLSTTLAWRDWFHVNVSLGVLFLPLVLEAAVRLTRAPGVRPAIWLGAVLGLSVLVNQQNFVIASAIAFVVLLAWLIRIAATKPGSLVRTLEMSAIAVGVLALVSGPQLLAMAKQASNGGASPPIYLLTENWYSYGATLPSLFGPSPRLASYGLGALSQTYNFNQPMEGVPTYGAVLTALAVLGFAIGWRYRTTWSFLALWMASAALALGTSLIISTGTCSFDAAHPGRQSGPGCRQYLPLPMHLNEAVVRLPHHTGLLRPAIVSDLMPYSWLVRVGSLSGLREANRLMFAGLIAAALLAGLTVQWLSRRRATMPLIALVAMAGALEAGWSAPGQITMPARVPGVSQVLAADQSRSLVVDVPFGLRGGVPVIGERLEPWQQVAATQDGHPRAISYTAWVPGPTITAIESHPFYRYLMMWQSRSIRPTDRLRPGQIRAVRKDMAKMGVGWVVQWMGGVPQATSPTTTRWPDYLVRDTYSYDGVARFFRALGLRRVRVICLREPQAGCPVPDQVWLWKP